MSCPPAGAAVSIVSYRFRNYHFTQCYAHSCARCLLSVVIIFEQAVWPQWVGDERNKRRSIAGSARTCRTPLHRLWLVLGKDVRQWYAVALPLLNTVPPYSHEMSGCAALVASPKCEIMAASLSYINRGSMWWKSLPFELELSRYVLCVCFKQNGCASVYVCACSSAYVCHSVSAFVSVHASVSMCDPDAPSVCSTYMCACLCVCVHVSMQMYVCVCACVCVFIYAHKYMYPYVDR